MEKEKLREFFDRKVEEYNKPAFIKDDPISIPYLFTKQQDIEIAAFFAAIFAWGNRTIIIKKSKELLTLMEMQPYAFIMQHNENDLKRFLHFKHRTFNSTDLLYFISFLKYHFNNYNSLEEAFFKNVGVSPIPEQNFIEKALIGFHKYFFSLESVPERTRKHIATPQKKSNCKRLNMLLRWMARKDNNGVDFGIWEKIHPAQLICPIDLHVARVAKRFNLLQRKQVDWPAALELTDYLRSLDPLDPVKYDFALFGLGVIEKY